MGADPDNRQQTAYYTGAIFGTLLKATTDPNQPLYGASVQPVVDDDGNYTNQVEITVGNGTYRLAVFEDWTINEERNAA